MYIGAGKMGYPALNGPIPVGFGFLSDRTQKPIFKIEFFEPG
jgi:hypothetical protein